ncbi:trypsin-like serine protease [Colwellia sp. E2M01]|uniref:trypsin-like serine protease n=1 Tax=Colwellia sp. E2M01 TaxID=2841561 RepID=UPI001C0944AF|nr:trypsin-like serine protease [Colwellia sp. E2M01]MBU2870353.1 trypsin-like serine protease [Colwellia sp. E2M01]
MKYIAFILLTFTISLIPSVYSSAAPILNKNNLSISPEIPISMPKIVGGELADEGDWPWMSALVFIDNERFTSLTVDGVAYNSAPLSYSPLGQVTANIVDCGIGDYQCDAAKDKICLIARGEIDFSVKADNCQAGGGVGAIIYNNNLSELAFTLGEDFSGSIPVISVSLSNGSLLLDNINKIITITNGYIESTQVANCGASFIGSKWVLTAAHCVEDTDIERLKVNVGGYDLTNSKSDAKSIKNIYIHPEYNVGTDINNDIALIELVETINHPAIPLLSKSETAQLAADNSSATVLGWGNVLGYGPTDPTPDNSQPDKLQQVELTLLTNDECKSKLVQAYKDLNNTTFTVDEVGITDSMICAHHLGGGRGSCQGDSGGPLIVNTNHGWQQIGIVSHGIGCADENYPDIYARVGQFTEWINSITLGIAIEANYKFPITPQYKAQTQKLNITNNSNLTTDLTYTLQAVNTESHGFSLVTDNCTTLSPQQTCQIEVTFNAQKLGKQNIEIIIDSNNIPTSQATVSAEAVAASPSIDAQLSNDSNGFSWFSGGDQPWQLDDTHTSIVSGDIADNEQSSVLLVFSGAGDLSFEWKVSSEANNDNIDEPYDALFLHIDGEQIAMISGLLTYETFTINDLPAGEHLVTWTYKKDALTSEGQDQGFLKNVVYTPAPPPTIPDTPNTVTSPEEETSNNSSGGSTSLTLFIGLCIYLQRRLRISAA